MIGGEREAIRRRDKKKLDLPTLFIRSAPHRTQSSRSTEKQCYKKRVLFGSLKCFFRCIFKMRTRGGKGEKKKETGHLAREHVEKNGFFFPSFLFFFLRGVKQQLQLQA